MADKSASVRVTGISELNRAFRQVDATLPKELRIRFLGVAQKVAGVVRARMTASFRHGTGKAVGTVKAAATARGARVEEGFSDPTKDYVPWLDFGGKVGRHASISRAWQGRPDGAGRYIYPAIKSEKTATAEAVDAAIIATAHAAGFTVTGSIAE